MVDIKEFTKTIVNEMNERYIKKGMTAEYREIVKNNGSVFVGIGYKDKNTMDETLIYTQGLYDGYICEDMTFDQCVREVREQFDMHPVSRIKKYTKQCLVYEDIKDNLRVTLRNTERNIERHVDCVCQKWQDLTVEVVIQVETEGECVGSMLCKNQLLKLWGVSPEEVYKRARENTIEKEGFCIISMDAIFREVMKERGIDVPEDVEYGVQIPLYVLTNKCRNDGSIVASYDTVLRQVAQELNSSFYIIPSSIHEVLLCPFTEMTTNDSLAIREIVHQVNREVLLPMEFLSDSVYFYNKDEEKITMF